MTLTILGSSTALAAPRASAADVEKMNQEWAAISGETVAPEVVEALAFEAGFQAPAVPREIVYEMPETPPGDQYGTFNWTERARLTFGEAGVAQLTASVCSYTDLLKLHYCTRPVSITDRSGLIPLYRSEYVPYDGAITYYSLNKTSHLSRADGGPVTKPSDLVHFDYTDLTSNYQRPGTPPNDRTEWNCKVDFSTGVADEICSSGVSLTLDYKSGKPQVSPPSEHAQKYRWDEPLNLYVRVEGTDPNINDWEWDTCLAATCVADKTPYSHKVVDYRIGPEWHSKAVSAALSAEDRQKANGLFAAGFDSYKSGDFISAAALLQRGLAIDPANYQAYYTLAEVARSALAHGGTAWQIFRAFYFYQRTVDLAPPDSVESIKSQAHITSDSLQ